MSDNTAPATRISSPEDQPAKTAYNQVEVDGEFNDESTDFALRSSDGVTFLVHPYHLMSGRGVDWIGMALANRLTSRSQVFRDMLKAKMGDKNSRCVFTFHATNRTTERQHSRTCGTCSVLFEGDVWRGDENRLRWKRRTGDGYDYRRPRAG